MGPLQELCARHKLFLVEDAAQAHGARYRGRRTGGLADAAAFSFYPSKNLGAYGDGGAVTTDDAELADRVRLLRNLGQSTKYVHVTEARASELLSLPMFPELEPHEIRCVADIIEEWSQTAGQSPVSGPD